MIDKLLELVKNKLDLHPHYWNVTISRNNIQMKAQYKLSSVTSNKLLKKYRSLHIMRIMLIGTLKRAVAQERAL